MRTEVGHTVSQGWEVGVRRTFPISIDQAWEILFTQPVLGYWLDKKANLSFQEKDTYTTATGISILVTSVTPGKVIRMKWQTPDASNPSVLQIRVLAAKENTTISFHHEKLPNGASREKMKAYWEEVLKHILRVL